MFKQFVFIFILFNYSLQCTTLLVGKLASSDGTVMATHSADGEGNTDSRLMFVPAQDYNLMTDNMRPVYPDTENFPRYVGNSRGSDYSQQNCFRELQNSQWDGQQSVKCNLTQPIGFIPQVTHTFSYSDADYGIMNEKKVAIGESTCSAKITTQACSYNGQRDKEKNCALLSINELSRIALERASTAREAVKIIGDLATEYGFYGPGSGIETGAESLKIIDENEGFELEILASDTLGTSAIWVAQRVKDDEATVTANAFVIREIDYSDSKYMMGTAIDKMIQYANQANITVITSKNGKFDFAATFSNGEFAKYYTGRRIWRALSLLAPKFMADNSSPYYDTYYNSSYPFSVKPENQISPFDLMAIHRDWYGQNDWLNNSVNQTTEFDLSQGMAAGPYGNPNRYTPGQGESQVKGAWERGIDLVRTSYWIVVQSSENNGVTWFSQSASHASVAIPLLVGLKDLPKEVKQGWMGRMAPGTSYFVNNWMNTILDLRFNSMIPYVIQAQKQFEQNLGLSIVNTDYKQNNDLKTQVSFYHAQKCVEAWKQLADYLVWEHASGFKNSPNIGGGFGYPKWWLEDKEVNYTAGRKEPTQIKNLRQE